MSSHYQTSWSSSKLHHRHRGSRYTIQRESLKQFFREHDLDGDGRLSIDELKRAFGSLGAFLPLYRAYAGRFCADSDGDGFISEDELDKLVDYAEKCRFNII